jgi:hypothetical protein
MFSNKVARSVQLVVGLAIVAMVVLPDAHATPIVAAEAVTQGGERGLCYHTDPSDWTCPDSTFKLAVNSSALVSATITIVDKAGRSQTVRLPAGTDAVFLSSNAVRNFLIRYYRDTKQTAKLRALTAYVTSHAQ